MILFYIGYNLLGFMALYFQMYLTAFTLFLHVPIIYFFNYLLNLFKLKINTNQFIDGQYAAIEYYNEDKKS